MKKIGLSVSNIVLIFRKTWVVRQRRQAVKLGQTDRFMFISKERAKMDVFGGYNNFSPKNLPTSDTKY